MVAEACLLNLGKAKELTMVADMLTTDAKSLSGSDRFSLSRWVLLSHAVCRRS